MANMVKVGSGFDVKPLLEEIDEFPELWNRYDMRRTMYEGSPHKDTSDLWLRYRDFSEFNHDDPKEYTNCKDADYTHWFAAAWMLEKTKKIIERIVDMEELSEFGACLITKIPPGKMVFPHMDTGYHAEYYKDKYLLLLKSAPEQKFCYEGEEHTGEAGDLFWFDNSACHWVTNRSPVDRMSLIIAGRK
jgi:hypothetical protein